MFLIKYSEDRPSCHHLRPSSTTYFFFCVFIRHQDIGPQPTHARPAWLLLPLALPPFPLLPFHPFLPFLVLPICFISVSKSLIPVWSLPIFLLPWVFQWKDCLVMLLTSFLSVCPVQRQRLLVSSWVPGTCLVLPSTRNHWCPHTISHLISYTDTTSYKSVIY